MENATYIWGAGHFGALAALDTEQKGQTIAGFIDGDKELQGKKRLGYEVFAPENILSRKGINVIVAISAVNEITEELEKNGYVHGKDFDVFEAVKKNYNGSRRNRGNTIIINELELIENIGILFENEVVLYGAGFCGSETAEFLKKAGISVAYFCDDDNSKWGQYAEGIEIISPSKLRELDNEKNLAIIIASLNVFIIDQIIDCIVDLKLRTNKIYTRIALGISLRQNINDNRISEAYRNNMHFMDEFYRQKFIARITDLRVSVAIRCIINCMKSPSNILVYQAGKVGSTTIRASIAKLDINCNHIHILNDWEKNVYQNVFKDSKVVRIITLVRDPISRELSHFFHNIGNIYYPSMNIPIGNSFMSAIIEHLKSLESAFIRNKNMFSWFDRELKSVFGIDIYAHPFDREKGYTIIKQGNVEVLAMKLEKLNSLESVIGDFIDAPEFKLVNANDGDNKSYKYLYKNVKDTIKIPREIFDMYYKNNPKMNHFYTEEEKAAFLKKWEKNIED